MEEKKVELKDYYPAIVCMHGSGNIAAIGASDIEDPCLEGTGRKRHQVVSALNNKKLKVGGPGHYDLKAVKDFDWSQSRWKKYFNNRESVPDFWTLVKEGNHPYVHTNGLPLEEYMKTINNSSTEELPETMTVVLPNQVNHTKGLLLFSYAKNPKMVSAEKTCNLATAYARTGYTSSNVWVDTYLKPLFPKTRFLSSSTLEWATLAPPPFQESYLTLTLNTGGWNWVPVTKEMFEDNTEMIERVNKHILLKGIEVKYLRKVFLTYFSDGGWTFTPDSLNKMSGPYARDKGCNHVEITAEKPSGGIVGRPCIYHGWAYMIYFMVDGKDILCGNRVFFTTPEYYVQAMEKWRPDLVKDFVPWSDLMFISSDWCERNGSKNYQQGIDLSTPHQRRLSLFQWIIGPCASRSLKQGTPFSGVTVMNGHDNSNKLDRFTRIMSRFSSVK